MQVRNLSLLVVCQLISTSGSIVMVMLGGIIGSNLSTNQAFATLPLSMMVVAIAATTIPATMLMRKIGRRKGFALSSLSCIVALLTAIFALQQESFVLFILAVMIFGINMAFTQQYRYFAAESVAAKHVPRAISLVLAGSIGAAFVGKELATRGQYWIDGIQFAGSMIILAVMFAVQALLFFLMVPAREHDAVVTTKTERSLSQIVCQPVYIVAVLGATAGFGLMTLVMTATPLSMHVNDGYSLEQTANVIQAHVLAMYVPSLVAGFLIERIGVTRLMFAGALGLLATSLVGLQGHTVLHYWWALVLLGVGWNFLYVGGTTMLTYSYSMAERFRAQAVNEFLVFGTSATASLLAGTVMHYYGWGTLMLIPMPFLIIICVALIAVRGNSLLLRKGRADA
ncbi:MAG: MFS transporter [Gammaproteobacteria bacterium]|jgi:MFS family permease|nr:MFS transporter [Gammaproteobacteria bacterium]